MEATISLELVKQGAEGRLFKTHYLDKTTLVKERFKKKYRNSILDDNILKDRMKAEARGLLRSKAAGVGTPAVYLVDIETRRLYIEYIDGCTVKDYIEDNLKSRENEETLNQDLLSLTKRIGSSIAKIHKNHQIHGDLTTSNMMLSKSLEEFYLIDFGLSFVSSSAEDKGVDLYVLERALLSTHACSSELFKSILNSYTDTYQSGCKEIIKKFEEVKARGRKRTMVG